MYVCVFFIVCVRVCAVRFHGVCVSFECVCVCVADWLENLNVVISAAKSIGISTKGCAFSVCMCGCMCVRVYVRIFASVYAYGCNNICPCSVTAEKLVDAATTSDNTKSASELISNMVCMCACMRVCVMFC